jgi:hypothetical protein
VIRDFKRAHLSMPHALIQLISEQTLPNILAALALRPTGIVHVASTDQKCLPPIRNIERALALSSLKPANYHLSLPSLNPTPDEVSAARTTLPGDWQPTFLNLTGGTKLMSPAAYCRRLPRHLS